jgi:hypothetical protein
MAHTHTQQVRHFEERPVERGTLQTNEVVDEREVVSERVQGQTLAARLVWFIAGVLLTLLAFRFVLAALGANPGNAFVQFIYNTSHPFVAPFFGLFSYDPLSTGASRFEIYTLIAMAVYALVAYGLARLLTIDRRHYE